MRAIVSDDVARIRALAEELFKIAEEVGLDIDVEARAGDKNSYSRSIELSRANGYRDLSTQHKIPGRVDIDTHWSDGETWYTATSDKDSLSGIWYEDKGDSNGHIAALFEEVREETIDVGRRTA